MSDIPPESSKKNPKRKELENYLKNRTIIDKIKDEIYNGYENYVKEKGDFYEENFQEDTEKNIYTDRKNVYVGRRIEGLEDSSSFSLDENNDVWQKYLDKNWNLMPNTTKTFGLPTTEQLKAQDLKQGEEAYNTFL